MAAEDLLQDAWSSVLEANGPRTGPYPVGGGFEGTVELQLPDGTFDSWSIHGTVAGTSLEFGGGETTFQAKIDGRRVSGSYTFPNGVRGNRTAVH